MENLYVLTTTTQFAHHTTNPNSGNYQFLLCIYEFRFWFVLDNKSLCFTDETNIRLYVNYISI